MYLSLVLAAEVVDLCSDLKPTHTYHTPTHTHTNRFRLRIAKAPRPPPPAPLPAPSQPFPPPLPPHAWARGRGAILGFRSELQHEGRIILQERRLREEVVCLGFSIVRIQFLCIIINIKVNNNNNSVISIFEGSR